MQLLILMRLFLKCMKYVCYCTDIHSNMRDTRDSILNECADPEVGPIFFM